MQENFQRPGLNFAELRNANVQRCEEAFFGLYEWTPTDWGCALAGEAGELCNLLKKMRRGEDIDLEDVGRELADVVIYADLLAARLGLRLAGIIPKKFNETSVKVDSDILLKA